MDYGFGSCITGLSGCTTLVRERGDEIDDKKRESYRGIWDRVMLVARGKRHERTG